MMDLMDLLGLSGFNRFPEPADGLTKLLKAEGLDGRYDLYFVNYAQEKAELAIALEIRNEATENAFSRKQRWTGTLDVNIGAPDPRTLEDAVKRCRKLDTFAMDGIATTSEGVYDLVSSTRTSSNRGISEQDFYLAELSWDWIWRFSPTGT